MKRPVHKINMKYNKLLQQLCTLLVHTDPTETEYFVKLNVFSTARQGRPYGKMVWGSDQISIVYCSNQHVLSHLQKLQKIIRNSDHLHTN
jgi:hypothetical protein